MYVEFVCRDVLEPLFPGITLTSPRARRLLRRFEELTSRYRLSPSEVREYFEFVVRIGPKTGDPLIYIQKAGTKSYLRRFFYLP